MRRLAFLLGRVTLGAGAQPRALEPVVAARQAQVQAFLLSKEPVQLAWGAYLAGEYLEPSFVPSIVPLLRHEHPDVQLAAIDALLRLNADLPAESLGPFPWTMRSGSPQRAFFGLRRPTVMPRGYFGSGSGKLSSKSGTNKGPLSFVVAVTFTSPNRFVTDPDFHRWRCM
jgi:hypothetical protein